jgi:type IV pilus assembly protein PilE
MKNKKGFSLTDLVVTLVVVAIIAIIAVPIYRGYVKRGIATEGNSLLGEINAAQQIYYTRHGQYFDGTEGQNYSRALGISVEKAKYFKSWTVHSSGDTFTAITRADGGYAMTLTGSATQTTAGEDSIIDNTNYD